MLEYQTLVLREDMDTAAELLPTIPADQLNKIARFLEGQGHKELALEVATDPEHKFDLALALNQLDIALDLARKADVDHKWKTVGDAALAAWDVALAAECFAYAKDLGSLLLLHSSTGDREGLSKLADQAQADNAHNVAFSCYWLLGEVDRCIEVLVKTSRLAEAVLFAQTYKPSLATSLAKDWKESLEKGKKGRVAKLIGIPDEDVELFPEWDAWLEAERQGSHELDTNAINGDEHAEARKERTGEEGEKAEEDGEGEE